MFEDFAPQLARILTEYSAPIHPGDFALILASTPAAPLIEALYAAILRRGGHPAVFLELDSLGEIFIRDASAEQLAFADPILLAAVEHIDVLYSLRAPTNTKSFSQVDPARLALRQQAQRDWRAVYGRRSADGSLRWSITAWPTPAAAQQAEMSLLDYHEFIYRACALDEPDPLAHWQALRARQERLVEWLAGRQRVEVRGPGVDLRFSMDGRRWISSHGTRNFPSGEIFTSPVEESVNGWIEFSYPAHYAGREVNGIRLVFEEGCVTEASASKGEDFLISQLDLDAGARRLGEVGIGTNTGIQRYTGEILFDEKIGGTIHLALGNSYPETGGENTSAIHWDILHEMRHGGEILVDGELFYRSGTFMVE